MPGPRGIETREILRGRATRLRRLGYGFLLGIVSLLGVGSVLFVNASLLSLWDISQVSNQVAEATATLRDVYGTATITALKDLRRQWEVPSFVENRLLLKIRGVEPELLAEGLSSVIADAFAAEGPATAVAPSPTSDEPGVVERKEITQSALLEALSAQEIENRKDVIEAKKTIRTLGERKKTDNASGDPASILISTQITRFGAVAMVIFLVTIFVSLYRYSVRLSAFYDARADALLLLNITGDHPLDASEFRSAVEILSPDTYDFGKMPQSMIERAFDVVAQASTNVTRKVGAG